MTAGRWNAASCLFCRKININARGNPFIYADLKIVFSYRNQPVKKLTMGYITNYSYCTATVSA